MDRYKKVSLEEMLNTLVKSIIQKKEAPTFYYSVAKNNGTFQEFIPITEIDLLRDRLVCYDGNFSCYDWELENSNIYLFVGKQG